MSALAIVREQPDAAIMEQVVVVGDLSNMKPPQRVLYYRQVCDSLGLNWFTKPFDYLRLNGKLVLYARKDATEQLRKINRVSITRLDKEVSEGVYIVTAYAQTGDGRVDSDIGAVSIQGLTGEAKSNAMMKAITKAKRRVTLSVCGLGWLDETEIDSIPDAREVPVNLETGEIVEGEVTERPRQLNAPSTAPTRPAPEPLPAQERGVMANIPTNPQKFMEFVNGKVEVPYDNLPHLLNALQQEAGNPKWNWPVMRDADGWQNAYMMAIRHAESKVAADSGEGETETEEAF